MRSEWYREWTLKEFVSFLFLMDWAVKFPSTLLWVPTGMDWWVPAVEKLSERARIAECLGSGIPQSGMVLEALWELPNY